ncbi:response regulator [Sphingomonas parva]|uniref:Response regulator n=1 Tax=Sphingomonas parva TaxID=2555898 RepID=A0A4Y8ZPZ5_9SPHN|nr:response regulator [Sphingomonas parva]TFI58090.1 response regulator [Sphingomonas parva]
MSSVQIAADAPPHIAVVDDEPDLRDAVATYLRANGYEVSEADGGEALHTLMRERPVDLVVLDVNMPGEDGITIARQLRSRGPVGIVMLTANTELVDRVTGLEVGADDYVGKPFELRELLARIRAVLRRLETAEVAPATMGSEVRFGRCILDLETGKLRTEDGADVPITAMEHDLLAIFARNPNKVLSRHEIMAMAHHKEMGAFDRSVDLRIVRLRRKIEADPRLPRVLKTVRGGGYVFAPAES